MRREPSGSLWAEQSFLSARYTCCTTLTLTFVCGSSCGLPTKTQELSEETKNLHLLFKRTNQGLNLVPENLVPDKSQIKLKHPIMTREL